jgi:hypothetical protein
LQLLNKMALSGSVSRMVQIKCFVGDKSPLSFAPRKAKMSPLWASNATPS